MPLTLLEAKKLAAASLQEVAVIDEFMESGLLRAANLTNIDGNALAYTNVEKYPNVGFRIIGQGPPEGAGVLNPQSEALKPFGANLEIDVFTRDTEGDGARASHAMMQVRASRLAIERTFIKGDSLADPSEFDGLQRRIVGSQKITNATNGGPLSLGKLDEAIDACDAMGGSKVILLNKSIRRKFTAANRNSAIGGVLSDSIDEMGKMQKTYGEIPFVVLDADNKNNQILPFTEVCGTSTECTSIYVVSFGDMTTTFLQGKARGKYGIAVTEIGEVSGDRQHLTAMDWYIALAIKNGRSVARLEGITDAPIVV